MTLSLAALWFLHFRAVTVGNKSCMGERKAAAALSEMTESIQSELKEHKVSKEGVKYLILNLEKMSA